MNRILMTLPSILYSGTKGSGPVLSDGKHIGTIAAVALTDDSVNNPFSDEPQEDKIRMYCDVYPVVAVKLTNPQGGITERFHWAGFKKYAELTEAEKAEVDAKGKLVYTMDTSPSGYALKRLIGADGKTIGIETGEVKDGKPVKVAALGRILDAAKSATAQRIMCDFLVACGIAEVKELTPEIAVEQIKSCTRKIGFTVVSKEYDGKRRARLTSPQFLSEAVATDAVAATSAVKADVPSDDDFE